MADSTPVTFKRKGARPTQRSRPTELDAEATVEAASDTAGTREDSPSVVAAKLKNKLKTRIKPKSKLSFGADEDGGNEEVFQLKKSNLSRKLTLGKQNTSSNIVTSSYDPTSSPAANDRPTYNAAYLSELKAATPTSRPRIVADESGAVDGEISMSIDPPSGRAARVEEVVDLTGACCEEKGITNHVHWVPIEGDVDVDMTIPSSSAITAAKEKRERLRKAEPPSDDFISLSLTKREDYSKGPHPESRLVREDDELGEGDDEYAEFTSAQERIALGKKSKKLEARKRRDEMSEMIVDAEEQDEETLEWEQEQLRRGGLKTEEAVANVPQPTYKPTPIPSMTPIPSLTPAIARLTAAMTALTTSHAQNTATMTSLADERAQIEIREKQMRDMIAKAEDKRSWFSAFREWIESVATFLDEKYPQLEKLEEEHISLLQERSDIIAKRRKADDEDDLSLFLGILPTAPVVKAEETDELGREVPHPLISRHERMISRSDRRLLHRVKRGKQEDEEEGFSTDSSLWKSDEADFDLAIEKLDEKRKDILADVRAKDFKDPTVGLSKWFGEWRDRFGDIYTGAWGGLGMVGAWEFWTRLEIVGWDPLWERHSLDTFAWYRSLYDYSRPRAIGADEEDEPELGPDGDLVSAMISTAIIPRLCKIIEGGAFDAYSAQATRSVINIAEQIEVSVQREDLKFQMLLKSVFVVFQRAASSTESTVAPYLALNNPRFDPEAIPARRRFLNRCTKLLINMTRWRKYTGERFGIGIVMTNLCTNCMLPIAESGWDVGGEECMRRAVTTLPAELVSPSLQARMRA
ncbi:hypothetical protein BDW22DRAFT_1457945 [Trametopsis cervina]|nr:hypothetical protein BDW22DRAFT_1457945 [Trametopsis cervina]